MKHLIAIFVVCAITAGCFGTVTNSEVEAGTVLLDDCTSKSRVVWDAYLNASGRVDSLIKTVSPKADFSTNNGELVSTIGVSITNLQNKLTSGSAEEGLVVFRSQTSENAERANSAYEAENALSAANANTATYALNLGGESMQNRSASSIFSSIDSNSNSVEIALCIATNTAMSITNKIPVMPWRIMSSPYGSPNISGAFVQWKSTGWDVMANIPAYGTQSIVSSPRGKIDDLEVRWEPNEWAYGSGEYYLIIERDYTNSLGFASPDAYVKWTRDVNNGYSALTVGDRSAGIVGQFSFAQGHGNIASAYGSAAMGDYSYANAAGAQAFGAKAYATNRFAFAWNGVSTDRYGAHGIGTFNVNPVNGEFGIFIGEKPLYQIFSEWATGRTQSVIAEYAFDNGDSESYEYREYAPLALAKAEDVESVRREASASFALFQGSNIVLTVTNYNSVAHDPALYLRQLNENNEYITVWHEKTGLEKTLQKANEYADGLGTNYAPKAWSRVTSGLGAEAPENTTWISTPMTVFAGGLEYAKYLTTGGAVYVLTGNGMATFNPNTNSYFTISTDDGEELFSIQKTDSQILPIDASGITVSGNVVTVPINLVSASAPILSMCTDLAAQDWKSEADESGIPASLATSAWTQTANGWVNTVTLASPVPNSAFFKYFVMQEGETIIKNKAQSNFDGGMNINGVRYRVVPYTTGGKTYMTLEAW